ncbi:hypothetical protein I204_00547 [Kwoniella mangroviensis CBS 8886]|uniref:uncharacterized protein n=1 Tax=Kwoniella mangroviensis CBS 8507 TaxID=1296122 RepID=UPI00080D06B3|nr:uncharacterized protein I203_07204 [Kwoniella mangroviensis CBS 8507]OCF63882.1 hypothetical protein I203_07204 [Kwoniella mangroviensis CBS 8507]OCF78606.1 hypothetical protein I204_00547 [Kwoniella mangroviensis CBS 8886]
MESYLPAIPSQAFPSSAHSHSHSHAPQHSLFTPEFGLPFYTKGTNTYYGTPHTLLRAQFPGQETFSERADTSISTEREHGHGHEDLEPDLTFIPRDEHSELSINFKDDEDIHSIEFPLSKKGHREVNGNDTIHPDSHVQDECILLAKLSMAPGML